DLGSGEPDDVAGGLASWDGVRQQEAMKTSITWSPAAGLNVVSVEWREQAWTVTVDSRLPGFCPGCSAQSKSPQQLLANVPGSIRSGSAGHCSGPPRVLEVSKPAV